MVQGLVAGGPFARRRFAVLWPDTDGLKRLADAKRAPLPEDLSRELVAYHRRLGAHPRSLESLDRLARGEAVCTVAGQQPAPLGGPLYSLHKTASAIGLSSAFSTRTGMSCVPLFWMHGEDSDFAEIRSALVADSSLQAEELKLPDEAHRDGGLVGGVPTGALLALCERALARWEGLPARADAAAAIERSLRAAVDLGEACSALMLALFGESGLVIVDPRLPAFRAAARPIVERYLASAETLALRVELAGDLLEREAAKRPLAGPALESFVFAIEDGVRRKLSLAEARRIGPDRTLSPSVALRPVIQDGVFPTVAMACGAAEVAYLAQLREVFEGVGVRPACVVPRLSATWLPPAALALLEASGAEPWELIVSADQVLKRHAERETPGEILTDLARARSDASQALDRFAERAGAIDSSLPQMVDSARGKVDYQYARLVEGLVGKVRHRIERQHPEWPRLRYVLMPGDRLQERRLASLQVVAYRGIEVTADLSRLAEEQALRLERGLHEHLVLEL